MEIPKTDAGTYILRRAERSNGIILNFDGTRYGCEGENHYKVFNSMLELKTFIEKDKEESNIELEYLIYDHTGHFLEYV